MMIRAIAVGLALLAAQPVGAQAKAQPLEIPAGRYEADRAHTSVTFRISHFGLSFYTARFADVRAEVMLDPAKPDASRLSVTIDPRSVKTDFPFVERTDFDAEIGRDPRFLDGDAHPKISFVSRSIRLTGATTAEIEGDLSLRGVTKPVVLKAVLNGQYASHPMAKKPMFGISGTARISRKDFGLTIYEGALGDEVEVLIESEFAHAPD